MLIKNSFLVRTSIYIYIYTLVAPYIHTNGVYGTFRVSTSTQNINARFNISTSYLHILLRWIDPAYINKLQSVKTNARLSTKV